jgi:polar amino acid transport system substrate-binding protein
MTLPRRARRATAPLVAAAGLLLVLSACSGGDATDAKASPDAVAAASDYAEIADAKECADLREANPDLVGTTKTNALNPHTPGYEVVNPDKPDEFQGFDIDLGDAIGACLGFDVDYVAVGFSELIPTVASGQADWIVSNLYATQERAQGGVDFISYSKVFDGVLVAKGNPKKIAGIDTSICGLTIALNKGYVEIPLVEAVGPDCEAAGKPAPTVSLFDSSADCVQAILAGRADAYMNDVNTVNRFIDEHPDELDSADTVMLDYEIGIGVLQGDHKFRDAVQAALTVVQDSGLQTELAEKWELDANAVAEPTILSVG